MSTGLGAFKKAAKTTSPAGAKKKDRPQLQSDDLQDAVNDWKEAKRLETQAKTLKAQAEAVIIPAAEEVRVKHSMETGDQQSTVVVNETLNVTVQNRYSAIDPTDDNKAQLKDIFGEAGMNRLFEEQTSIALSKVAMNDDSFLNLIIQAIGEENVDRYFDVKTVLKPKPNFHTERYTNDAVQEQANRAISDGLVTPAKASVKIA